MGRVVLLVALVACSSATRSSGTTGSGASTVYGGVTRTYILARPTRYDPAKAYPLVYVFHGSTEATVLVVSVQGRIEARRRLFREGTTSAT